MAVMAVLCPITLALIHVPQWPSRLSKHVPNTSVVGTCGSPAHGYSHAMAAMRRGSSIELQVQLPVWTLNQVERGRIEGFGDEAGECVPILLIRIGIGAHC